MKISASLMCADIFNLEKDIKKLDSAGIDLWHIDIMDGNYVPNLALNFVHIEKINQISDTDIEVHVMAEKPDRYIKKIAQAGADYISVHLEAIKFPNRILNLIKSHNIKAGLAINPGTGIEDIKYYIDSLDYILIMTVEPGFAGQKYIDNVIPKIGELKNMIDQYNKEIEIIVDGNINVENGLKSINAGANILVAGTSSVFKSSEIDKNLVEFKEELKVKSNV
ncbi:MAG: ribulose-phosphate 3-epimerase [Bacillota bacterium]